MKNNIEILEKILPKPIVFHLARALNYTPPPMLVTFRDKTGAIRREYLPL